MDQGLYFQFNYDDKYRLADIHINSIRFHGHCYCNCICNKTSSVLFWRHRDHTLLTIVLFRTALETSVLICTITEIAQ